MVPKAKPTQKQESVQECQLFLMFFCMCVVFRRSGPGLHPGWIKGRTQFPGSISNASPATTELPVGQRDESQEFDLSLVLHTPHAV